MFLNIELPLSDNEYDSCQFQIIRHCASLNISTGNCTMSSENRIMSGEACFATDTIVRCEVKKTFLSYVLKLRSIPADNHIFKANNRNIRKRCEICSKLTIKTPERHLASFCCLYFYFWTYIIPWPSVFIVNLEQVNASWDSVSIVSMFYFIYWYKKDKFGIIIKNLSL